MKLNQIGFQLYTCRDLLNTPAGIAATFKRLRAIGYTAVELCGVSNVTDNELKCIAEGEGIAIWSAHLSSENLLAEPEKAVERLDTFGCSVGAYPYPAGIDFASPQAVAELIAKLQSAGQVFRAAGKTLCYHNHHHEFRKIDGKLILDRIYDGTSRDALQAELDTYWVQFGGGNVVEWCEKMANRLPVLHLKDYEITSENTVRFCEIGAGNLNFKKIIAAAEASGCRRFVVEQDTCPGDPVDSLAQSFRYIQENLAE